MWQNEPDTRTAPVGVISKHRVHVAQPMNIPLGANGGTRQPRVELLRENGQVTAIQLTCPCGETFVLECEYEASA